jgi:hypothetical protein
LRYIYKIFYVYIVNPQKMALKVAFLATILYNKMEMKSTVRPYANVGGNWNAA